MHQLIIMLLKAEISEVNATLMIILAVLYTLCNTSAACVYAIQELPRIQAFARERIELISHSPTPLCHSSQCHHSLQTHKHTYIIIANYIILSTTKITAKNLNQIPFRTHIFFLTTFGVYFQ